MKTLILFFWIAFSYVTSEKSPLILVPGTAGSQLWAKTESDLFQIWVSITQLYLKDGINEYLKTEYNQTSRFPMKNPKANILSPFYGDPSAVSYLDYSSTLVAAYMNQLVKEIKRDPFFIANKTFRAAPYDFRMTPRENKKFISKLKNLVEETYRYSKGRRVTIMGHSYGGTSSLIFLNKMTDKWKKKYVKSFISVAGVFGGAVKPLKCEISGDNLNIPMKSSSYFRDLIRSMPGLAALLPEPSIWPAETVLVQTDQTNYTQNDYEKLFNDMNFKNGYLMWQDSRPMFGNLKKPTGIDNLYCVYGKDIPTPEKLIYSNNRFPDHDPYIINGQGDGTVNERSLELCANWSNVKSYVLPKAEHFEIITDTRLFEIVKNAVGWDD